MSGAPASPLVVVVTGASSGIGRATAILLSKRGGRVVLAARSERSLVEAQRECREGMTLVVPTDVAKADEVNALFATAVDRYGRVDAVVHSAAVMAYGRFEDVPAEVFDAAITVTLLGTSNVSRAALRQFASQRGGSLVVVGSLLGKIATPYMSSYVTAKWAVHGLVRCLQIEARQTPGISVSLVTPGSVDTPVYRQAATYLRRHGRPPPPVSTPEKVAEAVVLCLEQPSRETSVGPANALTVLGFRAFPGLFDRIVTPLMRLGGIARSQVENTTGNVLQPRPSGDATHGGRRGVLGRWVGGAGTPPDEFGGGGPVPQGSAGPYEKQARSGHTMTSEVDKRGPASVTSTVKAPASAVWATLSDGWLYASWVVGASRVREVDASWPRAGSRIHHSVGLWPTLINDETVVLEAVPDQLLQLQAKAWPLGEARVDLRIEEVSPEQCQVTIVEDAVKGPGTLLPRPARTPLITVRNREALRRLTMLAEGRHRQGLSGG